MLELQCGTGVLERCYCKNVRSGSKEAAATVHRGLEADGPAAVISKNGRSELKAFEETARRLVEGMLQAAPTRWPVVAVSDYVTASSLQKRL